jgi:hypothetical protein
LSTRIRCGLPQRAKQRRRVAWVSIAGTAFQNPRGEDRRLQDGAGAFVDDPQPTGLAIVQLHLVGGVHLPGLVRSSGSPLRLAAAATGGGGVQIRLSEGTLEGPLTWQGSVGMSLGQDDSDDPGSPVGVQSSHGHGGLDQVGLGPARLVDAATGVIRGDPRDAHALEAADQFPDGFGIQPQIGGNVVGLVAEAGPLEDHLPLRLGDGTSHFGPPGDWT